jgi:hypothetical protein
MKWQDAKPGSYFRDRRCELIRLVTSATNGFISFDEWRIAGDRVSFLRHESYMTSQPFFSHTPQRAEAGEIGKYLDRMRQTRTDKKNQEKLDSQARRQAYVREASNEELLAELSRRLKEEELTK